tara:strand:- start:18920 stop:19132 length:213 start_codon:yes stop_codon:yes gene_type:complete
MEKNPYSYTLLKPIQENYIDDDNIDDNNIDDDNIDDEESGNIMSPPNKSVLSPCIDWYNSLSCCSIYLTL